MKNQIQIISVIYFNSERNSYDAMTFRTTEKKLDGKCKEFKIKNIIRVIKEADDPAMPNFHFVQKTVNAKAIADELQEKIPKRIPLLHPIFNRNKEPIETRALRATA